MKAVLCWDIDGTLLRIGQAGMLAGEQATRRLFGQAPIWSELQVSGMTDPEIAATILIHLGIEPSALNVFDFIVAYEEYLPSCLEQATGYVVPGVREILDYCSASGVFESILLTGNTQRGANAKLQHFGLGHYFAAGAFAEEGGSRETVAQKAWGIAREMIPGITADYIFVIGDTPYDIRCGKAIGAKTVSVATGLYQISQLIEHSPWWAVESLPEPSIFVERIMQGIFLKPITE